QGRRADRGARPRGTRDELDQARGDRRPRAALSRRRGACARDRNAGCPRFRRPALLQRGPGELPQARGCRRRGRDAARRADRLGPRHLQSALDRAPVRTLAGLRGARRRPRHRLRRGARDGTRLRRRAAQHRSFEGERSGEEGRGHARWRRRRPARSTGRTHPETGARRAFEPAVRTGRHVTLPNPPLLVVTDRRQTGQPLIDIVRAALAAGCRWISLRERDLPDVEQIALVDTLLPLVRRFEARLMLHGDARVATRCGVDGVHLAAGGDAAAARTLLGPDKLVGISVHGTAEATMIDPRVVDYIIAGPFRETSSKPGYGPALGRGGLAEIARASAVPVVAIGGID